MTRILIFILIVGLLLAFSSSSSTWAIAFFVATLAAIGLTWSLKHFLQSPQAIGTLLAPESNTAFAQYAQRGVNGEVLIPYQTYKNLRRRLHGSVLTMLVVAFVALIGLRTLPVPTVALLLPLFIVGSGVAGFAIFSLIQLTPTGQRWTTLRTLFATDPREAFARYAPTDTNGALKVGYTTYKKIYKATIISLGVLLVLVVVGLGREVYQAKKIAQGNIDAAVKQFSAVAHSLQTGQGDIQMELNKLLAQSLQTAPTIDENSLTQRVLSSITDSLPPPPTQIVRENTETKVIERTMVESATLDAIQLKGSGKFVIKNDSGTTFATFGDGSKITWEEGSTFAIKGSWQIAGVTVIASADDLNRTAELDNTDEGNEGARHVATRADNFTNFSPSHNDVEAALAAIDTAIGTTTTSLGATAPGDATYVTMSTNSGLSAERVLTASTGLTLADGGSNGNATLAIDSTVATLTGSQVLTNKSISGSTNTLTNIPLTTAVTGVLPVGNGGTGTGTAFTAGAIVFATSGGTYTQNPGALFWNNSTSRLGVNTSSTSNTVGVSGGVGIGVSYSTVYTAPTNGLIVEGKVGIGSSNPGPGLGVGSNVAIGSTYSSSGGVPTDGLVVQGKVGVGTSSPGANLGVSGNATIGANYAAANGPTDGLIVQGKVGIGSSNTTPGGLLGVVGSNTDTTIFIDQNGNGIGLDIDSEATTADVAAIDGTILNSGDALQLTVDTGSSTGKALRILGGATGTTEKFNVDSNGDVGIGTATFGTNAVNVLALASGTAPATAPTDTVQLWAEDVAGSHELRVMDEAGNISTQSPHNFSLFKPEPDYILPWSFYSKNIYDQKEINVDMYGAIAAIEQLAGKQFIYARDITTGEDISPRTTEDDHTTTELAVAGQVAGANTVDAALTFDLETELGKLFTKKPNLLNNYLQTPSAPAVTLEDIKDLTLAGTLVVHGSATFKGNVEINGKLVTKNTDVAGELTIPAGATKAVVTFMQPFGHQPLVIASAVGHTYRYALNEISPRAFTITLSDAQQHPATFTWFAIEQAATTKAQVTYGHEAAAATTPTPLVSPLPSVVDDTSPVVSPVPTPSVAPSPTPSLIDSPLPSPAATPPASEPAAESVSE